MPPHKSEGHAGFIGAALAMALIGGGLVIWKVTSTPKPTEATATAPAAATTPPPQIFADPPPPPPPDEAEADAGADATVAKQPDQQVQAAGRGPCQDPCEGNRTGPLESSLRAKAGQARSCYQRALRTNATLKGRMTVSVKVGSNGTVCGASVGSDSLRDPTVKSCVLQRFRAGSYPPPQGGCLTVQVPLNFVPKS